MSNSALNLIIPKAGRTGSNQLSTATFLQMYRFLKIEEI